MSRYTIIAFDPGSRWTGVAALTLNLTTHEGSASTMVLSRQLFYPAEWLNHVLEGLDTHAIHIVSEEFRIRPKRYETWASGETLQLLGALRYVAENWYNKTGFSMRPSQLISKEEMSRTPLYAFLKKWRLDWPTKNSRVWEHSMAAWKVLLHFSLTCEVNDIRHQGIFQHDGLEIDGETEFTDLLTAADQHVAPNVCWRWA